MPTYRHIRSTCAATSARGSRQRSPVNAVGTKVTSGSAVFAPQEVKVGRERVRDWTEVAAQVLRARERAGFSQGQLAERLGMSRSSLTRVELGQRRLDALELARLAEATGRPVEWFVSRTPEVFASHRTGLAAGQEVDLLEDRLELVGRDVELLVEIGALTVHHAQLPAGVTTLQEAEAAAATTRSLLGQPQGPMHHLQAATEQLGLLAFSFDLGSDVIDGGYARISNVGVALINGSVDAGRRRFNLAHELGHHVLADEYTVDFGVGTSRDDREALINAFAIHFLLPRTSIARRWQELAADWSDHRMRLVVIAAEYRVSWSAMVAHALKLGLIDRIEHESLQARRPRQGDYVETGVQFDEEMAPISLPASYAQSVIRAYRRNLISADRAMDLLHGALTIDDLPQPTQAPIESLTGEFKGLD